MIIYNPLDGDALTSAIPGQPRHCFLMTRLGNPIPLGVQEIRTAVTKICKSHKFNVIDATSHVTGRDFLLKIWRQIASVPLVIGVAHENIPSKTQANIYYEFGIAQAMGKETVLVKSVNAETPSDFVRTEYVEFGDDFDSTLAKYLESLEEQAEHYETVADQLEKNPILALDYLHRAYLITGDTKLRKKARAVLKQAKLQERAANSVELLAASF